MPAVPHFRFPFGLTADGAHIATVDQDSDKDVRGALAVLLSHPLGSRPDFPAFGIPEQAFLDGGPHLDEIRTAIAEWEPRAATQIDLTDAYLTDAIARVQVGFDVGSRGGP